MDENEEFRSSWIRKKNEVALLEEQLNAVKKEKQRLLQQLLHRRITNFEGKRMKIDENGEASNESENREEECAEENENHDVTGFIKKYSPTFKQQSLKLQLELHKLSGISFGKATKNELVANFCTYSHRSYAEACYIKLVKNAEGNWSLDKYILPLPIARSDLEEILKNKDPFAFCRHVYWITSCFVIRQEQILEVKQVQVPININFFNSRDCTHACLSFSLNDKVEKKTHDVDLHLLYSSCQVLPYEIKVESEDLDEEGRNMFLEQCGMFKELELPEAFDVFCKTLGDF